MVRDSDGVQHHSVEGGKLLGLFFQGPDGMHMKPVQLLHSQEDCIVQTTQVNFSISGADQGLELGTWEPLALGVAGRSVCRRYGIHEHFGRVEQDGTD